MSNGPLRFESNAICEPSGDHIGHSSSAASEVKRVVTPREASIIHTSTLPLSVRCEAMRVSSFDKSTEPQFPTGPKLPKEFPDRSNQVKRASLPEALRYANMPLLAEETTTCPVKVIARCSA